MIKQPFGSSELAAIDGTTAATQLSWTPPTRGFRGYRIWNLSPAFWQLEPFGRDDSPLVDIVFPWEYVQGSFAEELEKAKVLSMLLPLQPVPTMTKLVWGIELVKEELKPYRHSFLGGDQVQLVDSSGIPIGGSNSGALAVKVQNANTTTQAIVNAPSDGQTLFAGLFTAAFPELFTGATADRQRTPNVFKAIDNIAVVAGTPQTIWTPAAGKKFRLMAFMVSLSVAGRVIFKDSGTELFPTANMAAGIGLASSGLGNGKLSAAANNVLQVDVSAAGNVAGYVAGTEE